MKTLLWIDDNEKLIDVSIPLFQRNGFSILKATNTSRALSILREDKLDGVLLDVRLSNGENGLELLKEIRRRFPKLPIAIFTGYPEYDDQVLATEIGANAYFSKIHKSIPVDPEKLRRFFHSLNKIFPGHYKIKKNRIIAIILFFLGIGNSLLCNVATDNLPEFMKQYAWLSWPLLLIVIITSVILLKYE